MKKIAFLLLAGLMACDIAGTAPINPAAPSNLSFQLLPSGDPNVPLGVLLSWDPPSNNQAVAFDVYGRSNSTGWIRRATTTSTTFHDAGIPQSQYYVVAIDEEGVEMGQTENITVDLADRLPAPLGLTSITLNGAVQLNWSDNAVQVLNSPFDHYRVYSSSYNAATQGCVAPWYFEGSTVSDAFFIGNLTNGVSRCYTVSAISYDGHESTWSNPRLDTPRVDAQSAFVYASETRPDSAGFVFSDEGAKKFGVVSATTRADADFTVSRHVDGTLWLTPARTGVTVRSYQATSISDLKVIDRAPLAGYGAGAVELTPGLGYVFRIDEADGTHYAALRVQFVASTMVVFDWSYQNGVGNPELSVGWRRIGWM